jgi:ribosome biogenesis GTPase / thiamine phosphate phosphatase
MKVFPLHDHAALQPLGWRESRTTQLPAGTCPARVVRHDGHTLLAATAHGEATLLASRRLDPQPTVGDWVALPCPEDDPRGRPGDPDPQGVRPITAVLPREALLRRLAADAVGEQVLAANVDLVLVVCGVDRPLRAGRVQRVATQAWDSGATPVLVLTKAADAAALDLPRLELEHPGLEVLACAALEGIGLDHLRDRLAGRTAVLVGESGSGKSTLTNALLGRAAAATGRVRSGDAKGRHTTTARQLHLLPGPAGGSIIDTPGIRSVGLAADADAVDAVFPEVLALAADCRFSDCGHRTEPGCAVLAAVQEGELAAERYEAWLRLQRELASAAIRSSPQEYRAYVRQFGRMVREGKSRSRP